MVGSSRQNEAFCEVNSGPALYTYMTFGGKVLHFSKVPADLGGVLNEIKGIVFIFSLIPSCNRNLCSGF